MQVPLRPAPTVHPLLAAIVLAAMVAVALPAYADTGPAVSGSTAFNSERKAALGPGGDLYVTYVDTINNISTVLVKQSRDGGTAWTTLPPLSTREAFRSAVAADSRGHVHVAWSEFVGAERQVFYARWEGGPAWLSAEQLSHTVGYSGFPSIAVDASDRVHLVWYGFDGANYQVFYTFREDAGAWAPVVQATRTSKDANNPAIAIGPDNAVHVAFFTYFRGEIDVWYMAGGPGGWAAPERVNTAGDASMRPSMVVLPDGTPAVAWAGQAGTTTDVRFAERAPSGNWSPSRSLSGADAGADNPSVAASPAGDIAVFYETSEGAIRSAVRIAGAWSPPTTLKAAPGSRWPSATWAAYPPLENVTSVFVVWTLETGQGFELRGARVEVFPPPPCRCGPADPFELQRIALVAGVGAAAAGVTAFLLVRRRQG